MVLILVFVADASLTAWRRGDRRKALIVGGSIELFLFAGLVTSVVLVRADLEMPLAISLYHQGLVAVMGYQLSRDVLGESQFVRELRASEARLRESGERFRLMADTAPVLVWRCRHRQSVRLRQSALARVSRGARWSRSWAPAGPTVSGRRTSERSVRTCASAFEARQPFRMEFRLRRADGAYRWVMDTGVPRYGPDGSFAGYIGSCLDITDRRASEDALRESQERYTLATAAGAVGVWDWNLETQDVYVDPTLKSILGFDDAEITNRADDWGSRVHADDMAAVTAHAQACIDGRVPEYEIEHRMTHKDRSVRWFLSRGTVLRAADGTAQRIVGTKVDITERKRAEEAIREKEAVLRVSDREIQHLAGRLIAAQEVERSRIARDLHDDTSQQLAGLAIALSALKRGLGAWPGSEDLQADVTSLQQRTIALAANLRHVSHDLHPSVLEHSGLVAALTAVLHRSAAAADRGGDVQCGGGLRLDGRGRRALPVSDHAGSAAQRGRARGRPLRGRPAAAPRRQRRADDCGRRQGVRCRRGARGR